MSNSLRVHVDNGIIVTLKGFRFRADHLKLLLDLQRLVPNHQVEAITADNILWHISMHRLVLDRRDITMLNPSAA